MGKMLHETLRYEADGRQLIGDLHSPGDADGPRPGILVFPDALGIGSFSRGRAEALAARGYVALACDIHGDGRRYAPQDVAERIAPIFDNAEHILALAQAGFEALSARPEVDRDRIAAIGYCFGGTMALELARDGAALRAVVGFHSGLIALRTAPPVPIRAKILACIGAEDAHVTADHRVAFEREMRAAGVDWRLHVYGGVLHSFTDPDAASIGRPDFARYDEAAARRSWHEMLALLDEAFVRRDHARA